MLAQVLTYSCLISSYLLITSTGLFFYPNLKAFASQHTLYLHQILPQLAFLLRYRSMQEHGYYPTRGKSHFHAWRLQRT